ncbi:MAG: T9SS type A sorting domain-containing protein [Ignavibacteria bacterium]
MSILKKLFAVMIMLMAVSLSYAQTDTVNLISTNYTITNAGTKFNFDIYALRITPADFRMGSSSFFFNYTPGTLNNAVLSNINPKYTAPNPSYGPMVAVTYSPAISKFAVQITSIGLGESISPDPGPTGFGERICTVTLNILMAVSAEVTWDSVNSGIVNPFFSSAKGVYNGSYSGTLPVELASFTSSVNKNNVTLNWATVTETNNNGFDIERKLNVENAQWSKIGFVEGNGNSVEPRTYIYNDTRLNSGKYNYRLKQIDFNGNFEYFELQNEIEIGIPTKFELSQNYPNPFNPSTKINFSIPVDGKVSLQIYDVSGRLISTLINNEFKSASYYTVDFNASDFSSGTYFYTIKAGNNFETKKMILVK